MDPRSQTTRFSALSSLLSEEQLDALASQGCLRPEVGPRGKRYFKLRFRMQSKQVVRYVGNNSVFVAQVERELGELQNGTKADRQLRRLTRAAMLCLKRTKRCLEPYLPLANCRFHGREIRGRPKCQEAYVDCKVTLPVSNNRRKIMDEDHQPPEKFEDAYPSQSTGARQSIVDERDARLGELRKTALEVVDPLRASIRLATASLLEMGALMGTAIKAALVARNDLRGVERALPAINSLTLVHRQTTRYVQLDRDWVANNDSRSAANRRRQYPNGMTGEVET